MQEGCIVPGHHQTLGMGEFLGQGQRLLTPMYGLHRIAQTPQWVRCQGKAPYPRRRVIVEHQGSLHRRVDESASLFEVRPGGGIFTQIEQGVPEHFVGLEEVRWLGLALRQPIELFPQLPRRRQRPLLGRHLRYKGIDQRGLANPCLT